MKRQIVRFSPHQNAKVVAILMALGSLVFLIPMFVVFSFTVPPVDSRGNPTDFLGAMFLLFPVIYLIFGYIFTVIGCTIYNFFFKYIGRPSPRCSRGTWSRSRTTRSESWPTG